MDFKILRLPFSAKIFLTLQTILAIASLFFIIFEALYLSPQKQFIKLDRISHDLAIQLQLISPLSDLKINRLLTATSTHNAIDTVTISWQDQQWQFNHARTAINKNNAHKPITASAAIYSLDGTSTLGKISISTKPEYRLNYLLAYSIALAAIFISIYFMLYFYLANIKKMPKSNTHKNLPIVNSEQEQALAEKESEKVELFLAKKSALEASRVKSTIIANTSHELLTPLNSIVGFSTILLDKKIDTEQHDNFLQRINDNALHLAALVNDLLDFSIRSNRMLPLNYQPTDIHALLLSITNTMAYEAQSKGLEFITDFDDLYGYKIHTDPLRLRQLISNLAINAIRYTNNGHIKITAHFENNISNDNDKTLLFCIEDTGIGIAKDQQEHIFSSFVSSTNHIKNNNNPGLGLGLGLSIVSTILQRMGAGINLKSELGQGSRFDIKVPIKQFEVVETATKIDTVKHIFITGDYPAALKMLDQRLQKYATRITCSNSEKSDLQEHNNANFIVFNACKKTIDRLNTYDLNGEENKYIHSIISLKKPLFITAPIGLSIYNRALLDNDNIHIINGPFAIQLLLNSSIKNTSISATAVKNSVFNNLAPRLKTLVVDDNVPNIELLSLLLTNLECDVDSATNGQDALVLIDKQCYEWLFIDIRMQPMSGIELVKKIRQRKNYKTVPIIACTAHTSDEEFRILIDSGFDKVTYKPVMGHQISLLKESLFERTTFEDRPVRKLAGTVFDIQQAVEKTAGNAKTARRIFELFLNELHQAIETKEALSCDSKEVIIDYIHRLHGASAMTGATALKNQLSQCETLLKTSLSPTTSAEKAIREEIEAVYDQIELVLEWHKNNDMDSIFKTVEN